MSALPVGILCGAYGPAVVAGTCEIKLISKTEEKLFHSIITIFNTFKVFLNTTSFEFKLDSENYTYAYHQSVKYFYHILCLFCVFPDFNELVTLWG